MSDSGCPIQVGVFALKAHADRAEAELRNEGLGDEDLGQIWPTTEGACDGSGLGTGVGDDVGAFLADIGIGAGAAGYYGREVRSGRCLLLFRGATIYGCHAIGRNCGTIRVQEDTGHP